MRVRLAEIRENLALLHEEQISIQKALAAVTYPVLTLPPEITSEIFVQCTAHYIDNKPDSQSAPLVLTYVCKAWRDIAVHETRLWRSFRVAFYEPERYSIQTRHTLNLVRTYLERAGTGPLDMHIMHVHLHPRTDSPWTVDPLLHDIIRRSSQWHKVFLSLPWFILAEHFRDKMDFSTLETLALAGATDGPSRLCPISAFAAAPKLRDVTLYNCATPSIIALPWVQLTRFDVRGYNAETCLEVLRLAPNLISCAFHGPHRRDAVPDILPPPHRQLRHLTICGSGLNALLSRLTLPKLEEITIEEIPFSNSQRERSFVQFIRRSPALSQFTCHFSVPEEVKAQSIVSMFIAMPKLSSVHLTAYSDGVEAVLRNIRDSTSFLPCVQSMQFDIPYEDTNNYITSALLSEALSTRWNPEPNASDLRSFRLVWLGDSGEVGIGVEELYLEAQLFELKRQGMDIYIGTEEESWI
ncbi:hypothetical protein B0H16DRAFT_1894963 [Mycena metata]|uniref:F-box domain-containing protein n=1 Tax=Mycena metata TaxID=1033252 RepID=A0AAD7MNS0_9AGAR|nr:hypothetical protein B0H16DRAFT_1894963 [Mycena metata]